eukprot:365326-Chlamydomonas_euryale.AAC.21
MLSVGLAGWRLLLGSQDQFDEALVSVGQDSSHQIQGHACNVRTWAKQPRFRHCSEVPFEYGAVLGHRDRKAVVAGKGDSCRRQAVTTVACSARGGRSGRRRRLCVGGHHGGRRPANAVIGAVAFVYRLAKVGDLNGVCYLALHAPACLRGCKVFSFPSKSDV